MRPIWSLRWRLVMRCGVSHLRFPLSGRRVPEYDIDQIREVFEGPYRIVYSIKPDQIDVLAVIHGAQDVLRDG